MRLLKKQKFIYFALDQRLVRRHKLIAGLIVGLQSFALLAVIASNILTNHSAYAAAYTWDGGGATNNWSDCDNWSTNICPTSADTVTFNATSTKNSTVDASFGGDVAGITIASGYTGTISLGRSLTSTGVFTQASGSTFMANSYNLTVATTFTTSAGSIFNGGTGAVILNGASNATITCGGTPTFNRVDIQHAGVSIRTISSNCNLPLGNNPTVSRLAVNGTLSGSGTLTLSSTSASTFNAGAVLSGFNGFVGGAVTISGADLDFSGYTTFDLNNAFILSSGSFTAPAQASFAANFTISGGTFTHNNGTVTFDGTGSLTCNSAVFNYVEFHNTGNVVINSSCTLPVGHDPILGNTGGHITLQGGKLAGSGTLTIPNTFQVRTGYDISDFSDLVFGALALRDGVVADFSGFDSLSVGALALRETSTMISGPWNLSVSIYMSAEPGATFDPNGGTVTFIDGDQSITGNITFYNLVKTASAPSTLTVTAGSTLTVQGDLVLQGQDEDNLLSLVSSAPGTQWNIDASGQRTLQYLAVQDSNNINASPMLAYDSEDLGNNVNWQFLASPTPEPPVDPDGGSGTPGDANTGPDELAETGLNQALVVAIGLSVCAIGAFAFDGYRRRVKR